MTKPKLSCFSLGWLTLCLLRAVWMKKKYLGQLTQSIFSPWSFPSLSWSETKGFAISAELPTMREKVSLWLDLVGLVWTTQATYRQHSIVAEEAEMCFGCSDRWSLRGPSVSCGDSNYWTAERGAREDAPTLCCWIFPLSRVFMCTWEWIVLTYEIEVFLDGWKDIEKFCVGETHHWRPGKLKTAPNMWIVTHPKP